MNAISWIMLIVGIGSLIALTVYRNVTLNNYNQKLIKAKEEAEKAREIAEQADKSKMIFLSDMSHDIRTPLNSIIGFIDIIKKHRFDERRVDDSILKIEKSSQHLLSLINDILDFSKIENNKAGITDRPFDLKALINTCSDIVDGMIAEQGISFNANIENITNYNLLGSELHIRQIMLNLLSNAVKYNRVGGTIDLIVKETEFTDDIATFEFIVADTGIGMTEEFCTHIFEPFAREEQSDSFKYVGTGLGMPIVKKLVDLMGGSIEVKSVPDEGSEFRIVLQLNIDHENNVVSDEPDENEIKSIYGAHILVAEDVPFNMEIVQLMLEESGASVDTAENGEIALQKFINSKPGTYDGILMDVKMPVMDGLEATRRIRSLLVEGADTIPIIAMTANTFKEDVEECYEAGMTAHIAKPINVNSFLSVLGRYINVSNKYPEKEVKVIKGYYWQPMYIVDSVKYISENQQDTIRDLLTKNDGVGVISGYYEEGLPVHMLSRLTLTMLGYENYEEFYGIRGTLWRDSVAEKNRAFFDKDNFRQISKLETVCLLGKDDSIVNARMIKRDVEDEQGRILWFASLRKQ